MAESARLDELQRKYAENPRRYFAPLANEYRKAGELSTAVAICREELARFPGHMSGHVVLGQALYESRRASEAQAAFERALELDPENLIALRHLGDIARDRGDLKEARAWYERVLEADPRNDDIAAQLSRLAPSYGRPTQAPAYVPRPTLAVAPPPPPAPAEPLLEPLEWTALDLGIPGHSTPDDEPQRVGAAGPDAPLPEAPADGLLDFEPTELTRPGADAASIVDAEADEPARAGFFSVISDEVSAIADDHGLAEPPEPRSRRDALPEPSSEAQPPERAGRQAYELKESQDAPPPRWDDLLPSLEPDAEEPAGAAPAVAEGEGPAAPGVAVATSEAGPALAAIEPLDTEPHAGLADGQANPARNERAAPHDGERAPELTDGFWQLSVDWAQEVPLTPVGIGGATPDAVLVEPPTVATEHAAVARAAAEAGSPPSREVAPAPPDVVPDEAVDVYDFLVPFEDAASQAATSEVLDAGSDGPRPAERPELFAEERGPAAALPFETAFLELDDVDAMARTAGEAAPFALAPGSVYDPVVGLDVPPAAPVPSVLAAAASDLDPEDGASPAPAGAFVTETMAQLLSQQGHLEQALEVYAQLQAHRPGDQELHARAATVRARLAPSAPVPSTPGDAAAPDPALPTAGAVVAALTVDEPGDASPLPAERAQHAESPVAAPVEPPGEVPGPATASVPSPGLFEGPSGELDERAALRLARAFESHEGATSLVSAIFDAKSASGTSALIAEPAASEPLPEPPAPALADAPYGLGEFSFERFFAGLEEDAPPSAPSPTSGEGRVPHSPAERAETNDPWPELSAPAPHAAEPRASDERTSPPDVAPPSPPVSDDEDLAQFNAWLKGLLEP